MNTETIYVDSLKHCHRTNDSTMTEVQTNFFIDKCDEWVEGYCYDTSKGYVQIYPWESYSKLDDIQREYERKLLAQYKDELAELDAVLLDMQYQNLVDGL